LQVKGVCDSGEARTPLCLGVKEVRGMVAYFVRRLVGAVLTLLVGGLVFYTGLVYWPGRVYDAIYNCSHAHCDGHLTDLIIEEYEMSRSWPANYLAYLFDSADTEEVIYREDYGSVSEPAHQRGLIGWPLLGASGFIIALMAIATLQRRRRPPAYRTLALSTADLRDRMHLSGLRMGT
jgi:hypothetical protein